ncbi:MAG: DNA-binding transcriptional regulator GbsR (MarR family) [Planctomycetota bacterium]|jgi:DNA-binding transcriptional regulator GbsR (MarR family)
MTNTTPATTDAPFEGLDPRLAEQLPTFELFFKTFGFKRIHGRVWGLLVLAGTPLTSKEISNALDISQGATSSCLNELGEWGAIRSSFDSACRSQSHSPVGNTLSIVATVFRRREQVVLGKLRVSVRGTLEYVQGRYGDLDPRVLTLRSILSSCEIADAVMQLVFSSVERALGDHSSLLSKALGAALKVGIGVPARVASWGSNEAEQAAEQAAEQDQETPVNGSQSETPTSEALQENSPNEQELRHG